MHLNDFKERCFELFKTQGIEDRHKSEFVFNSFKIVYSKIFENSDIREGVYFKKTIDVKNPFINIEEIIFNKNILDVMEQEYPEALI